MPLLFQDSHSLCDLTKDKGSKDSNVAKVETSHKIISQESPSLCQQSNSSSGYLSQESLMHLKKDQEQLVCSPTSSLGSRQSMLQSKPRTENITNRMSLSKDPSKRDSTGFSHLEWSASVPYNLAEEPDEVAGMKHSHSCQSMPAQANNTTNSSCSSSHVATAIHQKSVDSLLLPSLEDEESEQTARETCDAVQSVDSRRAARLHLMMRLRLGDLTEAREIARDLSEAAGDLSEYDVITDSIAAEQLLERGFASQRDELNARLLIAIYQMATGASDKALKTLEPAVRAGGYMVVAEPAHWARALYERPFVVPTTSR